jgi:hypothetical protein
VTGNLTRWQRFDPNRSYNAPSFRPEPADSFFRFHSSESVGLRREKSLFAVTAIVTGLLVLALALNAQVPTAVPIPKEPHHHLVLENDYVRVFRVSVPAHDATLLHQHDVPYLYVALGPADVINAVQGRPEARIVMADGQLGYSPGHFTHIARNESDMDFNNVTIELLKQQGEPRNTCAEIVPGVAKRLCSRSVTEKRGGMSNVPQFQTDEMETFLTRLDPDVEHVGFTAYSGTLFVLLSGSGIQTMVKGSPEETLEVGNVRWLFAGSITTFSNPARKAWSYLTMGFKESETLHKY